MAFCVAFIDPNYYLVVKLKIKSGFWSGLITFLILAEQHRYSPPQYCGTRTHKVTGNPDSAHISTSYAERMNLQIRMDMRRFTRLTNAHSKKVENHRHALALYFMYYNFARIHSTLRVTPAMQAGVAKYVWSMEEIVGCQRSHHLFSRH